MEPAGLDRCVGNMPIRRIRHPVNRNPLWALLGSLLAGITGFVVSLPLYVPFVLLFPAFATVRWVLFKFYGRREDNFDVEPMSSAEARWMGEGERSVMHAVLVLDNSEGLSMDQFRRILSTRVLPVYPRLTRIPARLPLTAGSGYCWATHSQFSISKHVFHGPAGITSREAAQLYVAQLMHQELSTGKPPWEFHIIPPGGELKETIVIARIHQSIGDGSELLRVLCHSLSDTPSVDIPERPQFTSFSFGVNVFRACLAGPCTFLIWLGLTSSDYNPLTAQCHCKGGLSVSWSATVTLPKVMRIKQVTRSTVNCVILSALAGALRALLQGYGIRQPPNVKVLLPVDIRSQNMSKASRRCLGNKSTSLTIPLPVSVEGCVPRLWATRRTLSSLNTTRDPVLLYLATATLMTIASPSAVCYLLHLMSNKTTLQYSSIAGPTSHLTIGGGRLKEMYCLVPATTQAGMSVTCITYDDQVLLSIAAESEFGAAARLILTQIEAQVETLWKLLLNRRVPGENSITCMQFMPEIVDSPMQQIEDRISEIQKEVIRLTAREQDQELQMLKLEYNQLVGELKRRYSDSWARMRHQRSRSNSLASHISASSLKSALSSHRSSAHSIDEEAGLKTLAPDGRRPSTVHNNNNGSSNAQLLEKHRKNSFEIVRFQNKRKDVQELSKCLTEKCDESDEDEKVSDDREMNSDYCDSVIKISDDECMDAGPIHPTLRDLYCSNYLEYKLQNLRQKQTILSRQFRERTDCLATVEDGLLI